ncbi:putative lipid II flippase FtsW [candidate division KSB1 bacterium]|nr:putative lipid II flippase FtsW [candidate division KSB1 bacterium]
MGLVRSKFNYDVVMLISIALLVVIGIVMIYSASSYKAQSAYNDSHYFLKNQIKRVLIGLLLLILAMKIDYHLLLKASPFMLGLAFVLLIYVLIDPTDSLLKGSRRWIEIKGMMFQPSEFAKFSLIFFLASFLSRKEDVLDDFMNGLLPALLVIGLIVVPVLVEPNMGTTVILLLISATMLFVAGARAKHLGILALSTLGVILLFVKNMQYQKARFLMFIDTLLDARQPVWQVKQSMISLGNGGFFGVGLGNSKQKLHFLPQPFTDFIYSIIGEELGFIGAAFIAALFIILMLRGIRSAVRAPDREGMFLAIGITFSVTYYFLINAGVATNLLPITGIPMPFISYGGSSLIMTMFAIGILLNVSAQANTAIAPVRLNRRVKRR